VPQIHVGGDAAKIAVGLVLLMAGVGVPAVGIPGDATRTSRLRPTTICISHLSHDHVFEVEPVQFSAGVNWFLLKRFP